VLFLSLFFRLLSAGYDAPVRSTSEHATDLGRSHPKKRTNPVFLHNLFIQLVVARQARLENTNRQLYLGIWTTRKNSSGSRPCRGNRCVIGRNPDQESAYAATRESARRNLQISATATCSRGFLVHCCGGTFFF